MTKNGTTLALISKDIDYIKCDIAEIKAKMEVNYITKEEFDPVRRIVYGLVSVILLAVVGALVGLVILR